MTITLTGVAAIGAPSHSVPEMGPHQGQIKLFQHVDTGLTQQRPRTALVFFVTRSRTTVSLTQMFVSWKCDGSRFVGDHKPL